MFILTWSFTFTDSIWSFHTVVLLFLIVLLFLTKLWRIKKKKKKKKIENSKKLFVLEKKKRSEVKRITLFASLFENFRVNRAL